MIFKKPYAFLIKHFKLLHLILSGLMIYLSIKINFITNLFNKLARNINVSFVSLSDKYINSLMYLVVIFIIIISFLVCFLMYKKKKPTKYYISILVYYSLIIVFLLVYNSAMVMLENTAMTNQALRAYRDIAFLFPLGQYYFIVIAILRGIGFNIKQFNFSKDIKELEISEADSEEIELNLTSDFYKYKRLGRKKLRELKYYFFENKIWILIIFGIVLISGIIYFFVNYKFVDNNYRENTFVNANKYNFQVNRSLILEEDLYGIKVNQEKKYVIVDLSVKNIYYENIVLDLHKFRLLADGNYYNPIIDKNSDFQDIGLPYDNKLLDLETVYRYILIYELDSDISVNNLKLQVYDQIDYETNKVNFININLKPDRFDDEIKNDYVDFNKEINIEFYGTTSLNVKNYQVVNNFEYMYEACVSSDCYEKTGVISPTDLLNSKLVVIDYSLSIDKDSNLYNFVKNDSDFFNTFVTLTYNLNGKQKNVKVNYLTNAHIKEKIFIEVPKEIEEAEGINLIINTRKVKYVYKFK